MGTWKSAYRLLLQYYLSLVNKCKCLAGFALVVHHLQSCLCYYSELKLKKMKATREKNILINWNRKQKLLSIFVFAQFELNTGEHF